MLEKIYQERQKSSRIVSLSLDGEKIGEVKMSYFSKPFPLYYIEEFSIVE